MTSCVNGWVLSAYQFDQNIVVIVSVAARLNFTRRMCRLFLSILVKKYEKRLLQTKRRLKQKFSLASISLTHGRTGCQITR